MKKLQNVLKNVLAKWVLHQLHQPKIKILTIKYWISCVNFSKSAVNWRKQRLNKIKNFKNKWDDELKQLEESTEIKNKAVYKIFLQLTGFVKFLKLKAEVLDKLEKFVSNPQNLNGNNSGDLNFNHLPVEEKEELIHCLNKCFKESECINTFILSKEVLKSFLDFLKTAFDLQNQKAKNSVRF